MREALLDAVAENVAFRQHRGSPGARERRVTTMDCCGTTTCGTSRLFRRLLARGLPLLPVLLSRRASRGSNTIGHTHPHVTSRGILFYDERHSNQLYGAILAASVVWIATSRGQSEAKMTTPDQQSGQNQLQANDHEGMEIAARYHLRGRTKRFFQRAGGSRTYAPRARTHRFLSVDESQADQIAARYHLRGRTKKFYRRVVG